MNYKDEKQLKQTNQEAYKNYKIERRMVKEEVETAKAKVYEDFGTKMEKDSNIS